MIVLIASALVVGYGIWYLTHDEASLRALSAADYSLVFIVAICECLFLFVNGLYLKATVEKFGIILSRQESFHVSTVTTAGNSFLPMTSGMVIRAYYLKNKYALPISKFLGVLTGGYVINYFIVFWLGLLFSGYLYLAEGIFSLPITLLFLCASLGFAWLIFRGWVPKFQGRYWSKLQRVIDSWEQIASDRKLLRILCLYCLGNFIISTVSIYLSALSVAIPITISGAAYLTALSSLSVFIKITPGNVGLTEALFMIGGAVLKLAPGEMLAAAVINRVAVYGLVVILFPFSFHALFGANWLQAWRRIKIPEAGL